MNERVREIREIHKLHEDFVRADGDLTRRIKAICRRLTCPRFGGCTIQAKGAKHKPECKAAFTALQDVVLKGVLGCKDGEYNQAVAKRALKKGVELAHSMESLCSAIELAVSLKIIRLHREAFEAKLAAAMESLPVWEWADGVRGFSHASLARLVGEIGDLADYSNPSRVWKRMGVGLVEIDGKSVRQRRSTNKDEAAAFGYNPQRRAILFAAMEPLIKQNPEYKSVYDARRAHTAVTHPDWTKMHSHRDAHAVMSKRFLKDLWVAWRAAIDRLQPNYHLSATTPPESMTSPAAGPKDSATQEVPRRPQVFLCNHGDSDHP